MHLQGIYQASNRGFGFFTPDGATGRDSDLFVPPRCDGGAWNGDRVSVAVQPDPRDKSRSTAKVLSVLERTNRTVVGAIERRGKDIWLLPSSERLLYPIKLLGRVKAHQGDRVAVSITQYGNKMTPPTGTLKEIFGADGTREASVAAILYENHIHPEFPSEVLDQADAIPQEVPYSALANRLDLRGRTVITIDGASSKDFDDAISLEKTPEGHWKLGVHIADVSHYVTPGCPLDVEAWERGTSVYFADQVVPMLPQVLSNGICSLNPQVDRLTLSCFMVLDKSGTLLEHTIAKTVICSTERMTYGDCNLLLKEQSPELAQRYTHILPMLQDMAGLAKILEQRRRLRGALDLESQEAYLICDAQGNPVDVQIRVSGQSEALIESFMLIANETVAKHLFDAKLPGVYRVHEDPSEDKANNLRAMLAPLGITLKTADNFGLQGVLKAVAGKPQAPAVHTMVLRSLMKARYDTLNLGHFGLAAPYYCHFTSPIRRYPDLMVHRVLTAMLDKSPMGALTVSAAQAATQSSQRELAAMTAERDIEKCYFAQLMTPHIGETFHGTVVGVTKFGLFVGLPNGIEGLVALTSLPDDRWEYDEIRMALTAKHSGLKYTFGDPIEVLCAATNPGSGQIDFTLPGVTPLGTSTVQPKSSSKARTKSKPSGKPSGKKAKTGYRPPKHRKGGKRR